MDGARNALAELMTQLENMQFGGLSQGGGMGFPMPGMEELGDMIGRQRGLMDETLQESQRSMPSPGQPGGRNGPPMFGFNQPGQGQPQGQDPAQGPGDNPQSSPDRQGDGEGGMSSGDLRAQQDALRQELGELLEGLRGMGQDVPGALDRALGAMEDAERDLGRGDLRGALDEQKRAIDQMRQGAQSMAQAMLDALGEGEEGRSAQEGQDRDPLGRPQGG